MLSLTDVCRFEQNRACCWGICLIAVIAACWRRIIPQDPAYHLFADESSMFSPQRAQRTEQPDLHHRDRGPLSIATAGNIRFSKTGSASPTRHSSLCVAGRRRLGLLSRRSHNLSLAWDRLPMTVAFMSFFAILLAERVSFRAARMLFPALLFAGIASIAYWYYSEVAGAGTCVSMRWFSI